MASSSSSAAAAMASSSAAASPAYYHHHASSSSSAPPADHHVASSFPSSSSSWSSYSGPWEYDVFLCFRGGDVRPNFMSHLQQALVDKKVKIFVDTMLEVTEDIQELISKLKRTAISIVIFSANFADSSWCLNEVATITQLIGEVGHMAIPVFYNVDWTTVAEDWHNPWWDPFWQLLLCLTGPSTSPVLYAKTIAGLPATPECKDKWREGLKAVASKTGRTTEAIPIEADLVKDVVSNVIATLGAMSLAIRSENLVGMESRVLEVERLLAMHEMDTIRIVGLQGMGGVGKTTLAYACYEKLKFSTKDTKFHIVNLIDETSDDMNQHGIDAKFHSVNIRGDTSERGVEGLVVELYSALLSENSLSRGKLKMDYRRARLARLRVFIVFDDVQTPLQLEEILLGEALNPTKLFAAGSRIIVTTRNQIVLDYAKAKTYVVQPLNCEESRDLFIRSAFRPDCPIDDRIDLSRRVISYCKGNPLALKVLGAALLPNGDKKFWQSFMEKLDEIQDPGILRVLRRSYDVLGPDDQKLFLDIACFFYGTVRSLLVKYMEACYTSAYSRVKDLVDKSLLISVTDQFQGEMIFVHRLLRDMAWNIVNEEPKVRKRCRLKNADDIWHLLTTTWQEDIATQGIHLDLSKVAWMNLKANAFNGMNSLRWLDFVWPKSFNHRFCKISLSDSILNSLPNKLSGLYWHHFPLASLPSGFSPKKLAYLVVRDSPIVRCWEQDDQQPKLDCLVLLSLTYCGHLAVVPNLWKSSNLEHLVLRGCSALVELPASIQSLVKLVRLDARDCENLERVPAMLNSKVLKQLLLSNCPKLTSYPEVMKSEHLQTLDLDKTPINALPSAVYKVKQGGMISLYGPNITSFPQISTSLELLSLHNTDIREIPLDQSGSDDDHHHLLRPRFDRLQLIHNSQLKTLPTNIWKMVSAQLIIDHCPLIEDLPEISEPSPLTLLHIAGCASITDVSSGMISNMKSVASLVLSGIGIKSLPSSIQELDQLSYLDLSYCTSLESIPETIHILAKLSELLLVGCERIQSLPQLPPNLKSLKANNCKSLRDLSYNIAELSFQHLRLDDCPQLDRATLDGIVASFPQQASSQHSQVGFHCSGSEIPGWFGSRPVIEFEGDRNSRSVALELPADCSELKGVAFGVVYSLFVPRGVMSISCRCFIEGELVTEWRSFNWEFQAVDSNRVHLWSGHRFGDSHQTNENEEDAWFLRCAGLTASFLFYAKQWDAYATLQPRVKKCGAHLLF